MKKILSVLLPCLLLLGLFVGCQSGVPVPSAPAETPAATEAPATEAPVTEAPATEPPATEPPATGDGSALSALNDALGNRETEAPEAAKGDPFFTAVGSEYEIEYFTNHAVEIRYDGDAVYRKTLSTGAEEILFDLDTPDDVNRKLVGVTNERLYFASQVGEDWWGYDVYSVDYANGDPRSYGEDWETSFEGGWLILLGFRSDVSSTELIVIDRNDEIVFEEENGAVWDTVVVDESLYFIYIEDAPDFASYYASDFNEDDVWTYDLIRIDPDGTQTVCKSFENMPLYSPAFFFDGVLTFMEQDEYYDLQTLQPVENPFD